MSTKEWLSKRVSNLKPSPTLALATQAKALKSEGKDLISLSVGEPDWDTFSFIKEEAISWLNKEKSEATKYTPASGFLDLRKAISQNANKDLNMDYTDKNVIVSSGAKFALFSALQCLVDPGDEVVVPTPYWVSYPSMVELAQGKVVFVRSLAQSDFKLKASNLEKSITKKTKVLILNTPNNPTGAVYSKKELEELAQVLLRHPSIFVISDDIYRALHFQTSSHRAPHLLQVEPRLRDQILVIDGVSKTYSMTGWRLGWTLGHIDLIQAMNHYQSQSLSCASGLSQKAALSAITRPTRDIPKAVEELKRRRDLISSLLEEIPLIRFSKPQGTFYLWLDVSHYLNRYWKGQGQKLSSTRDFARILLTEKLIAVVPGKEFGEEGFIRLSFAVPDKNIEKSVNRLKEFFNELQVSKKQV